MKRDQVGEGNYSLQPPYLHGGKRQPNALSPLSRAKNGMKIYLTDKDKVYTYEIREVKHVTPIALMRLMTVLELMKSHL